MAHSKKHTPPSAKKAMAGRMAKKKAAAKKKISKRQALMAERVERSPKKRRTVGQPPNRSMSAKAKAYQRSKMEQMRKGNPGAKKFQQPGGRRGSG